MPGAVRVGAAHVAAVRTMTDRIADILDELGGAHARPMAAAFLVNTVVPWLRAEAGSAAPQAGPRLRAFLRGQQAHTASMVGDHRRARRLLAATESALLKADDRRESIGGYDRAARSFHVAHVLHEGKDLPGSISALQQAIRAQPAHERQVRAHFHAVLAQRQLEHGHVDAACDAWTRFPSDYEHLSSARGDEHFKTMRHRLKPFEKTRAVRQLAPRVSEIAALKA
ncbi:hypothetical protein ACWEV4_13175 [Streptomyces sp. NPDC003860]